jgi:hypothetical protein
MENISGVELDAPPIGVAFFDKDGNVLGSTYALPVNHSIPSDRPMPFIGDIYDPPFAVADIGSVELWSCSAWGGTDDIQYWGYSHDGLEVQDILEGVHTAEDFEVTFKVLNSAEVTRNVRAVVAVYDSQGRYVGEEQATNQLDIPAGKSGLFKISIGEGYSSRPTPLEYVDDTEYTYEIWVAVDDQVWFVGC